MSARAIPLTPRTAASITLASIVGVFAFGWPLIANSGSALVAHSADGPWLMLALMPLVLAVVLADIADGGMDAKAVAILGVLIAVIAALRPLGGGVAGLEPLWAVVILGGRAFGPGFGFALGSLGVFASALTTGGVGPWLPFQMFAAAWVGVGAALLPPLRGRSEVGMLAGYGAVVGIAVGTLLNLWFWPFTTGLPSAVAYVGGAPLAELLHRLFAFSLLTSLGYDIPRAILTATLLLIAAAPLLRALRRVQRRAHFGAVPTFTTSMPEAEHVPATATEPA
jgi:energy-coupling factor transport system substrate-specific component